VAVIDYKVVPNKFTFVCSPSGPRRQWLILGLLRNSLLKVSHGCGKSSSELSRSETLAISKTGKFSPYIILCNAINTTLIQMLHYQLAVLVVAVDILVQD